MYEEFFGFHKKPFSVSPDPDFYYPSESHRQGLAHLRYGLRERMGFIVLTGEVGTGKTHLVRLLLRELGEDVKRALILNPTLKPDDLVDAILRDLDVSFTPSMNQRERLEALVEFLLTEYQAGRRVVLIVDESQNLSIEALERLRILTNLETNRCKLLQVLLVGQPELNLLLQLPCLRQVNQRVVVRHHLEPLHRQETSEFIRHRLEVAGGRMVEATFSPHSFRLIHSASKGIPRLISILCDYCLLIAFTDETRVITTKITREAVQLHRSKTTISPPKLWEQRMRRRVWIPAVAGGLALLVGLGLTAWNLTRHHPTEVRPAQVVQRPVAPPAPAPVRVEPPVAEVPAKKVSDSKPVLPSFLTPADTQPVQEPPMPPVAAVAPVASAEKPSTPPREPRPAPKAKPQAPPKVSTKKPVPPPAPQAESPKAKAVDEPEAIVGAGIGGAELTASPGDQPAAENPVREHRYGVQVASVKTEDAARKVAADVGQVGQVFVIPASTKKGDRLVKVIVGAFVDYPSASALASLLQKEGRAKEPVVVENRWWQNMPDVSQTPDT
jgi:general secretion pathway protein A